MNNNTKKVSIWDMLNTLWRVLANVINVVDDTVKMIGNLATSGGEVTYTVLETSNQFADVGLDFSESVRVNQLLKHEDDARSIVTGDPKMEARLASAKKKIADNKNARRSRLNNR